MKIRTRIAAFAAAICMTAGTAAAFPNECVSAEEITGVFNAFSSFDSSAQANITLKNFRFPFEMMYAPEDLHYSGDVSHKECDLSLENMEKMYEHYDTAKSDEAINGIIKMIAEKKSFDDIMDSMDLIDAEIQHLRAMYYFAYILFSTDTSDSHYYEEMSYTEGIIADLQVKTYNLIRVLAEDEYYYDALAEAMGGVENLENYLAGSETEGDDAVEYTENLSKLQGKYYELVNDESAGREDFAELYLEIARLNNSYARSYGFDNYIELAYSMYMRDYYISDAEVLCDAIANDIAPVVMNGSISLMMNEKFLEFINQTFTADEILGFLGKYTEDMSDEMNEAYKYMVDSNAYSFESGVVNPTRSRGAFTAPIPEYNAPYIFATFEDHAAVDLSTVFHEFGHYNEFYHSSSSNIMSLDVSEISSQALELLAVNYYDEIFGDEFGEMAAEFQILNDLSTMLSTAMVSEFEIRAYRNSDMSVDELIELQNELEEKYMGITEHDNGTSEWRISHIYENPGYCISYAVSMAAAFEIWNESTIDFDKAVSQYLDISATSSQYGINATLEAAEMNDIFDRNTMKGIAFNINRRYIGEASDEMYDVNGDGEITAQDALTILMYMVGNIDPQEMDASLLDIDRDGEVTAYDALLVLKKVVGLI